MNVCQISTKVVQLVKNLKQAVKMGSCQDAKPQARPFNGRGQGLGRKPRKGFGLRRGRNK